MTTEWRDWTELAASEHLRAPRADDDKYSRGVLGVVTGSEEYPGAAVLGVEAAVRTGLGMVRYLGPERPSSLVLQARPEAVTADGRVQAWLIGSGMSPDARDESTRARLAKALGQDAPVVIDAGALDLADDATGPAVLTPHAGELVTLLAARGVETDRATVSADPASWAERAADLTGKVVLLKGSVTHVCGPASGRWARDGVRVAARVEAPSSWAATAGSGDVLGGVVGALLAGQADRLADDPARLVGLAATGAYLHAWAAERASGGGPIAALDIAAAVPSMVARLLTGVGGVSGARP
ncbi:ADP/ATP-dependent (S)-NAD(P)H-hydrate dehydratase [Herbiconiux sp. KACC 21604]|uniref:ADP-dependent NAD(P)H-hydrate dehydratase n=1 Tax=unclassified Herbiconiux TaxID=2618217 RepID=UPI0014923DEA|nr:ADP/ATP-dependent (S)-NAD(P)H-hydrate dehydratase [Herbiconiux sp. SALV-R1]QJU53821.1 NAD(P)H-hydrate dehydratase [Herbiconiux sp. SALV-R1]WPO84830.1 ADP/ATP-dependent (S)-NAD(P)H-hydrate dehydratase [Herbiconiux sp. KACC 21604]